MIFFQEYNHDYYRNLTLAYYVIPSENTSESTTTLSSTAASMSSSSTGVLLTTLMDNASANKTNETQIQNESELIEHNPLLIPEVRENFLGGIDIVCVWLR